MKQKQSLEHKPKSVTAGQAKYKAEGSKPSPEGTSKRQKLEGKSSRTGRENKHVSLQVIMNKLKTTKQLLPSVLQCITVVECQYQCQVCTLMLSHKLPNACLAVNLFTETWAEVCACA